MNKYKAGEVKVEAIQYTDYESAKKIREWANADGDTIVHFDGHCDEAIEGLWMYEWDMLVSEGDYVVKAPNGYFYQVHETFFESVFKDDEQGVETMTIKEVLTALKDIDTVIVWELKKDGSLLSKIKEGSYLVFDGDRLYVYTKKEFDRTFSTVKHTKKELIL